MHTTAVSYLKITDQEADQWKKLTAVSQCKDVQSYREASIVQQLSRQRLPTGKTAEGEYAKGLYNYEAREGDKKQLFSSFVIQEKTWNYRMLLMVASKNKWS